MNPDFLDLLASLAAADARFLVVGGYAVGFHARPRATKDLDLWFDPSPDNTPRVLDALRAFGAPTGGLAPADLEDPDFLFIMGRTPTRIDLLSAISGVSFEEAWAERRAWVVTATLTCPVIGLEALIRNKRAAGRPQDLADAAALEAARPSR